MRQIKFRAWSKKDKCWCGAFSIHQSGLFSDMISAFIEEPQHIAIADAHWQELNDDSDITIQQFTGLFDKNGVEIYEGDVVSGKFPYGTIGVVSWIESRGGFMVRMIDGLNGGAAYDKEGYKLNSVKLEVIGNIYQNPELLTQ